MLPFHSESCAAQAARNSVILFGHDGIFNLFMANTKLLNMQCPSRKILHIIQSCGEDLSTLLKVLGETGTGAASIGDGEADNDLAAAASFFFLGETRPGASTIGN